MQFVKDEEKLLMLKLLEPKFLTICFNMRGPHALQKIIENSKSIEIEELVFRSIKDHIIPLALNALGTFVLQKIIMHYPEDKLDFVFIPIRENFIQLATDANGLPIIKKTLGKFLSASRKADLVKIISKNAIYLAQNAYGNYAVQVALDVSDVTTELEHTARLLRDLLSLSELDSITCDSEVLVKCDREGSGQG
jgi:hypothetical protein